MSSSSTPFQKRLVILDSDERDASTHDANATNVGEDDVEIVGYGHKRTPVVIDLSSEDEKNGHEVTLVKSDEHTNTNKTKREIIQSKKRKRFNFSSYLE